MEYGLEVEMDVDVTRKQSYEFHQKMSVIRNELTEDGALNTNALLWGFNKRDVIHDLHPAWTTSCILSVHKFRKADVYLCCNAQEVIQYSKLCSYTGQAPVNGTMTAQMVKGLSC